MARAAVRTHETAWKSHVQICGPCNGARAERNRRSFLCGAGLQIWDGLAASRAALAREREADAQPITGQGMLL
jgi:hypothetical protein